MGNHRFRLSDMIPSAWFYKLKDMGRTRNKNINHHPRKKKQPPTSSSSSSSSSTSSLSLSSSTTPAIPPEKSKTEQPHLLSHERKSYYFTRELTPPPQSPTQDTHFPDLPRKSAKQRRSTRGNRASNRRSPKLVTSATTLESGRTKPDSTLEEYPNSPLDSSSDLDSLVPQFGSCRCRAANDIVFNMNDKSLNAKFDGFDTISELNLPPITTKRPAKWSDSIQNIQKKKNDCNEPTILRRTSDKFEERNAHESLSVKIVKEDCIRTSREERTNPVRRLSVTSPGVKLRTNSPRIASRKIQAHGRKSLSSASNSSSRRSLSESFAVVKSSADPQGDFRESMVEMILENNIKASKDLEDLLACYLQLNSDEYHEVIIKVFKQIWFDLADVKLK